MMNLERPVPSGQEAECQHGELGWCEGLSVQWDRVRALNNKAAVIGP